ncbi:hypothetical protein B0T10DRAFT_460270 [Thelonectria olida]|uniref:BHLH domain-containing protein n=1 Tax=Thelonectria olida TaxID=1576542 RepID=A0A9P8W3V9_9HYPO|nr:hypothetical protein B0T10DRAFT_460270 [Thelonectria olida]
MHNMMGSTYLEATDDGASMGCGRVGVHGSWMGGLGTTPMSFAGLDASPYADDSPTTLQSPETPSLDQTLFPSPMGDFSYLDPPPFGDYPPSTYPIGDVSAGQFPLHMGHRDSHHQRPESQPVHPRRRHVAYTCLADVVPAHTPGAADDDDDLSSDSAPSEPRRRSKRRSAATTASSSSSSVSKKRTAAQLRTASRAPRKKPNILPQRPTETVEDVKARAAHNQVEQQYRKRLNAHFERLLAVLPAPTSVVTGGRRDGIGEKRVSKAEVLDLATERIRTLERQMARLEREGRELRGRLAGCVV